VGGVTTATITAGGRTGGGARRPGLNPNLNNVINANRLASGNPTGATLSNTSSTVNGVRFNNVPTTPGSTLVNTPGLNTGGGNGVVFTNLPTTGGTGAIITGVNNNTGVTITGPSGTTTTTTGSGLIPGNGTVLTGLPTNATGTGLIPGNGTVLTGLPTSTTTTGLNTGNGTIFTNLPASTTTTGLNTGNGTIFTTLPNSTTTTGLNTGSVLGGLLPTTTNLGTVLNNPTTGQTPVISRIGASPI